jgi:hypothetical protein
LYPLDATIQAGIGDQRLDCTWTWSLKKKMMRMICYREMFDLEGHKLRQENKTRSTEHHTAAQRSRYIIISCRKAITVVKKKYPINAFF